MTKTLHKTAEGEFVQIKKIGNSLGLILSKDILSRLKLKEGGSIRKYYPLDAEGQAEHATWRRSKGLA